MAPKDIALTVKKKLQENHAPVLVIYNHFGYWHAVVIAGFNDQGLTKNCPFVEKFITNMTASTNPKYKLAGEQVKKAYSATGCQKQGVFYIRDSIYTDKANPYDYDPLKIGDEGYYSTLIVEHEYQWLELLANHIYQIKTIN